ncbi:hypothetical protein HDU96_002757, partial [Phlyctochytrium bullatum]
MAATGPTDDGTLDSFVLEVQSDHSAHLRLYEPTTSIHAPAEASIPAWIASLSDHDLLYTRFHCDAEAARRVLADHRKRLQGARLDAAAQADLKNAWSRFPPFDVTNPEWNPLLVDAPKLIIDPPFFVCPSLAPKDFLGLSRHRPPSVSTTSVRSFAATAPVAPPFSFQLFVGQLKLQVSLPACVFALGDRPVLIFAQSLVPKSTSRSRPLSLLEAFRLYPREEFTQGLELARLIKRGDNLFAARQVFAADSAGRSRRRDDLTEPEIQKILKEIGQLLRRFEKYNELLKDEYQFAPIIFAPRQLANREREPDVYDRQLQDCAAFAKRIDADARNHLFQLITKGFHLFRDRLH